MTGGAGLIRTQIDGGRLFPVTSSSSTNQMGFNIGGGVMGFFADHIGVRGELRYMRAFSGDIINNINLGSLNFTRLSFGVVFR